MKRLSILAALLTIVFTSPAQAEWDWCWDQDVIRAEVDGADVTAFHDSALYNCCHEPFDYTIAWEGDRLVVTETEVQPMCYCLCCYDLNTVVESVPSGDWTLRFRWFDTEAGVWLQEDVPFTVGSAGHSGPAVVGVAYDSGCLSESTGVEDTTEPGPSWGRIKSLYR